MTKEIQNSNFQNPNGALRRRVVVIRAMAHWDLAIGHSLGIGGWTLNIGDFAALELAQRNFVIAGRQVGEDGQRQ